MFRLESLGQLYTSVYSRFNNKHSNESVQVHPINLNIIQIITELMMYQHTNTKCFGASWSGPNHLTSSNSDW